MTYASAGVDVEAGDRAVELIRGAVSRTHGPSVLGGIGGFAGLLDVSALKGYRRPLLATSTDGVGTKVASRRLSMSTTRSASTTIGRVDDVVVQGPAAADDRLHRLRQGRPGTHRGDRAVAGLRAGGCPGRRETAEHPGPLGPAEDLAGAATGVVEADTCSAHRVRAGRRRRHGLLGPSNGWPRPEGDGIAGWTIYRHRRWPQPAREPAGPHPRLRAGRFDLAAALGPGLHALAHVTGGGLAANLARVLPRGSEAVVDRGTWTPATIFDLIARLGTIARPEMERTFNLGVGMLAVVAPEHERETVARLTGRGVPAWRCGQVEESYVRGEAGTTAEAVVHGTKGVDGGSVRMIGDHPRA